MRQKTSADGLSWGTASNVVQVDSGTGNPALLQSDSGTVYLAYRKSNSSLYVTSNSGSGWSSPVQTTGVASGDPAFLQTETEIVLIYKGTDNYCYRISSSDGVNWSSPSQIAPNKIVSDPASVQRTDRSYRVTAQYISASALDLVRITEFSYTGSGYLSESTDVLIRDSQTLKSSMHFEYDSKGRTIQRISKDENGAQTEKTVNTYNNGDKVIRQDIYAGTSTEISYSVITGYDSGGNLVYTRNPEGAEHYYSYANTNSQNQFIDPKGNSVQLFSNQFYTNSVPSHCHTLPVGEAFINNGKVTESYYKYDSSGNMIEAKTLYPTCDYAVFSGTFYENGQTTFDIDLTGLAIVDAILVISSIAVPTQETFYETHSEVGKGWLDTGTWSGKYFMADYFRCYSTNPPDCFDGSTKIGPFEHYPGTPNYAGYTTWIEENTQYVKTSYTAIVNEYPEMVEYNLNNSSWNEITDNLGSGTTSTVVSASSFLPGANTLQFRESNAFDTRFCWVLYIDQGVSPEQFVTGFVYDIYGNVISNTDALGNTTSFEYDSLHAYPTCVTSALNKTITASYDSNTGLATSITDAKGETTYFQYDILGRVTWRTHPDLSEVQAVYDDQSNTVTIYDELGHYTIRYYDGLNRLSKIEWYPLSGDMLEETYSYDYMGNLKTRTDSGGHLYSYEYDMLGRTTKILNPDGTYERRQYNDVTNTVTVIDENQHKREYQYNWAGNLLKVKEYTDPVNFYMSEYSYDDRGNLISLCDANGNTTTYDYGSLFGMTQVSYPDLTTETFTYDAVGNMLQRTDATGTVTFVYNAVYQLVEAVYPDSSSVSFEYDPNGNRILMEDSEGTTRYVYDVMNHCVSETRTIEGESYTVNYTFDAASRLVSITYPDQSTVSYQYDGTDRLTSVVGYAELTYNADSLLDTMTYENTTITRYQYDTRNRPLTVHTQENDADLLLLQYQYDDANNVTELDYERKLPDQQWAESTEVFTYDALDRLVAAQGDYGSLSYSYDPAGNRLSCNNITYSNNNMNELLSTSDGLTFTYDDAGNMLTMYDDGNTWSYTYDSRNQLVEVRKNQQVLAQYAYDGDGKRIKKTEWDDSLQSHLTTVYVYSGNDIVFEKNVTTGKEATYIYGQNQRIAKKVDDLVDYYHTDYSGSTRLITDESGNVVTDVSYTPFGEDILNGEEDHFLFTGKEKESIGLCYYGARYYNPEIGRFLTRDILKGEIQTPQSLNRYIYCLNNPLKYIDPLGLDCEFVILPDGTISYEVADLLNRLNDALKSLNFDDVQKQLGEGDLMGALETVLREIFPDAEIKTSESMIYLTLADRYVLSFVWEDSSFRYLGSNVYGSCQPFGQTSATIYLNKDLIKNAGDLFCCLSHELTHAYTYRDFSISDLLDMSGGREDSRAYFNFIEAIAYRIEWRIMQQVSDDYLSERFKTHVEKKYAWVWLYYKLGPSYG
jgi:RHS repeat-associated protein